MLVDPLGLFNTVNVIGGAAAAVAGLAQIGFAAGVGAAAPPSAPVAIIAAVGGAATFAGGVTLFWKGVLEPANKPFPDIPAVSAPALIVLLLSKGDVDLANKVDLAASVAGLAKSTLTIGHLLRSGNFKPEELKYLSELIKFQTEILKGKKIECR